MNNQAIEFAEWIGEGGFIWDSKSEIWIDDTNRSVYTTEDLFETFMENQP